MPTAAPAGFSFRKGSIAKIEVWNFVTYDHSAIYPNDSLNLIVGPNGSGKSSIVCAMCLGFGGSPKLLQRGEAAKDYVQHDKDEAAIEISLATGNGNEVVVLRRVIKITRDDYGSPDSEDNSWFIDNRKCPVKEVKAVVKSYNIQLSNYTQFLPQDVVKEFPALTAEQLLRRTEEALGDTSMLAKHEKLIELHEMGKGDHTQFETQRKSLEDMKQEQENNRREVEKFKEWKEICERVEMMERRQPWLYYEEAMTRYQEYKQLKREAKAEFNQKQRAWEPKKNEYEKEEQKHRKFIEEAQDLKAEKKRKIKSHGTLFTRLEEIGDEYDTMDAELEDVQSNEDTRQRKIAKVKEDIDQMQNTIDELESQQQQAGGSNKEAKQIVYREQQEVKKSLGKNRQEQQQIKTEVKGMRLRQGAASEELRRAQDVDARKLQSIIGNDQDLRRAYDWVENNRDRFQKDVFGPLGAYVTVPDPKHALAFETLIGPRHRNMFVTQCDHDREVLNEAFRGTKKIFPRAFVSNYVASSENYAPKIPVSQLQPLGVTDYMDQLFDAPPVVKKTLCDTFKFHMTGYGSHKAEQKSDEVLRFINTLVTPTKVIRGSTSVHTGRRNSSVRYINTGHPKLYGNAVNPEEVKEMEDEVEALNTQMIQGMTALKALKGEEEQLQRKDKRLQAELDELGKKGKELSSWRQKLKTKNKTLEKYLDEPSLEQETERISKQLVSIKNRQHKQLAKMVDSYGALLALSAKHDIAALKAASMFGKLKLMAEEVRVLADEVADAESAHDMVTATLNAAKESVRSTKSKAEKSGYPSEEEKAAWAQLPQDREGLDEEIRTEKARAEAIGGNDNVLKEFERKEKQIALLEEQFLASQQKRDSWLQDIRSIHESWLPKLRELIEKVSEQFSLGMSEMGFAGEIHLIKPTADAETGLPLSFREFAIDIKVKFKDGQPIRSLDRHTQSGGEKSVSTMLYLISLQNLTEFPFRVVDEINQGMDARNERKMFEQIVRAASKEDCPQYFVITPKLLTGLDFSDCVKVHFVWNTPALCGMAQHTWEESKHCMVNVLKRKNTNAGGGGGQRARRWQ